MSYMLKVAKTFKATQGLPSPVRAEQKMPPLQPAEGYDIQLTVGIVFADQQLTDQGWFVDSDAVEQRVKAVCDKLAGSKWTELFVFRPTFERVAQWAFEELLPQIPQLVVLILENKTLGVTIEYGRERG